MGEIEGVDGAAAPSGEDGIPGVFVALDRDGLVTMWSAGAVELYGLEAADVVGRTHPVLVPEGEADGFTALHDAVRDGGGYGRRTMRSLAADGRIVEVEVTVDIVRSGDGSVVATVAHHRPVAWASDGDDGQRAGDAALDALCAQYGLDEVERSIVVLLIRGHRTDSIARSLSYASGSVRNRLSGMFAKFGVRGQSELVEVLHASLDGAARGDGSGRPTG